MKEFAPLNTEEIMKVLMDSEHLMGFYKFPEFKVEAGWGYMSDKRIDLFAMNIAPSKMNERRAYEIKVSRGDFTKELRTPSKRWAGMLFTNRFFYVAPTGLIKPKEVPPECGLIEIHKVVGAWAFKTKVRAPWRESMAPSWPFVISLFRAIERNNKHCLSKEAG